MKKSKTVGPFSVFRYKNKREGKNFVDVSLKAYENCDFGWNWGNDGADLVPLMNIRLFGLEVFRFDPFKGGFEVRLLGFWWIHG